MTDVLDDDPPPKLPNALLQAWLAQSRDLLALTDADGALVWANPGWRAATGLAPGAHANLFSLAPSAAARSVLEQALREDLTDARLDLQTTAGVALTFRFSTVRVAPHTLWTLQASPSPQPLPAPPPADDTLALFELAVDLGNIVIWHHDIATGRVHYNKRGLAVLGLTAGPEGLALAEVRSHVHAEDLQRLEASARQALQTEQPVDVEARFRIADGTWRTMLARRTVQRDAAGEPQAFIGVALDVTERMQQAELGRQLEALRDAGARSALITRHAGIGTWDVDFRGTPERWDEQMFRLRGLEPSDRALNREQRFELVHPADRHRLFDALPLDGTTTRDVLSYEFRVRLPDGSYRWLASRSAPLFDEHGVPVRRVGVNWDISASKTAESARHEKLLAERESRAKSEFLSRMSHELRTPLNAVLGFTQLLQADAQKSGSTGRLAQLGHVRAAGEHLLALITDVLDLSDVEAGRGGELGPVALAAVVAKALPQVEALATRHRVALHTAGVDGVVQADPTRLLRVMVKLLRNAIQYNRPGGAVWVEAVQRGSEFVLRFRDSGRGIRPEQLPHVFMPFNRLGLGGGAIAGKEGDRNGGRGIEGTGIGLTITRALVQGMGGTITAQSEWGVGSVFEVALPGAGNAAAEPPAPPEAAGPDGPIGPAQGERRGRLLYIEDNAVNVLLVEQMVGTLPGLRIESTPTGAQGVERARDLQPDLILIDLQLPDFDGFEVLRRLRQQPATAGIACIALSANAMPEDVARGLAAGFADYWTKPINFRSFLAALELRFPRRPSSG